MRRPSALAPVGPAVGLLRLDNLQGPRRAPRRRWEASITQWRDLGSDRVPRALRRRRCAPESHGTIYGEKCHTCRRPLVRVRVGRLDFALALATTGSVVRWIANRS